MTPVNPANAPLMKEFLLLHILVTTNPDYNPNNFGCGQAILDQIKADYNRFKQTPASAAQWDWPECSKVDTGGGVMLHHKFADDLYALANDIDPLITNAAQPSAILVPGWPGGTPAHPPVGDVIGLLSIM